MISQGRLWSVKLSTNRELTMVVNNGARGFKFGNLKIERSINKKAINPIMPASTNTCMKILCVFFIKDSNSITLVRRNPPFETPQKKLLFIESKAMDQISIRESSTSVDRLGNKEIVDKGRPYLMAYGSCQKFTSRSIKLELTKCTVVNSVARHKHSNEYVSPIFFLRRS